MMQFFRYTAKPIYILTTFAFCFAMGCADYPKPVNQEELITTVIIQLTPVTPGLPPITLSYYDADGIGSIEPEKSVSGPLRTDTDYTGAISFSDDTQNPAHDVTAEIKEEANDHLVCYQTTGANITVEAADSDSNGKPLGLTTFWSSGTASSGNVQITLRHQPGTKSGMCPGTGETDVQVDFDVTIQ